jgi:hypothetical protein
MFQRNMLPLRSGKSKECSHEFQGGHDTVSSSEDETSHRVKQIDR